MVYIRNRTWQIATQLEKASGFWPYQSKIKSYSLMFSCFFMTFVFIFGLTTSFIKLWNDNFAIALENFEELILLILLVTKILTIFFVEKKRRQILEQVATHFETVVEEVEVQILCDFADKGLRLTILSTLCIICGTIIFLLSPYLEMYFLYFFGDGQLRKLLPVPVDFLIDQDKYFYWIVLDMLVGAVACFMAQSSFDLSFFMTVRHACALFEIVKLRIAKASEIFEQCDKNTKFSDSDEKAYEILSSAVDICTTRLLNMTLYRLTQMIDDTYNVCMFILLLLNAVLMAPFPASMMLYAHEPFELVRRGTGFIVFPLHLYVENWQGQLIIDHSSAVFDACSKFHWYNTSKRCRAAISIIMSRSLTPSRLTGGNMFYLSMETYFTMLKTAISYISVFAAFLK